MKKVSIIRRNYESIGGIKPIILRMAKFCFKKNHLFIINNDISISGS